MCYLIWSCALIIISCSPLALALILPLCSATIASAIDSPRPCPVILAEVESAR